MGGRLGAARRGCSVGRAGGLLLLRRPLASDPPPSDSESPAVPSACCCASFSTSALTSAAPPVHAKSFEPAGFGPLTPAVLLLMLPTALLPTATAPAAWAAWLARPRPGGARESAGTSALSVCISAENFVRVPLSKTGCCSPSTSKSRQTRKCALTRPGCQPVTVACITLAAMRRTYSVAAAGLL